MSDAHVNYRLRWGLLGRKPTIDVESLKLLRTATHPASSVRIKKIIYWLLFPRLTRYENFL